MVKQPMGAQANYADSVRLAVLEMSRITEQVAILASYGIGMRKSKYAPTFRRVLCHAYLECLNYSLTNRARIVHVEPFWMGFRETKKSWKLKGPSVEYKRLWRDHQPDKRYGRMSAGENQPSMGSDVSIVLPLDIVICPLEGVGDTLDGLHGGSASILAGGLNGGFHDALTEANDQSLDARPTTKTKNVRQPRVSSLSYFFVIAAGHLEIAEICTQNLGKFVNQKGSQGVCVEKIDELKTVFEKIAAWPPKGGKYNGREQMKAIMQPTVATIDDEPRYGFTGLLERGFRRRLFKGSPTAAAVTALRGDMGVHVFAGVVRKATVLRIAVAARTLNKPLFAIELSVPTGAGQLVCLPDAPILRETDLVGEDTFLILTGVSAHPLLKGVRIYSKGLVKTQSLAFNARSRSVRSLMHWRDLREDHFVSLEGYGLTDAWSVIKEFRGRALAGA